MRHPVPQVLRDTYYRYDVEEPRLCHTCLFYDEHGICVKYSMSPPEEFAATPKACNQWEMEECPF